MSNSNGGGRSDGGRDGYIDDVGVTVRRVCRSALSLCTYIRTEISINILRNSTMYIVHNMYDDSIKNGNVLASIFFAFLFSRDRSTDSS